uniref:Uncharacterized protein n=1 Tax=Desulfobacca acetoxidans TaxID=60893 RepID=A0A7V4G9B4_9BACT
MKKLLVLLMALAVLAFALPAFANDDNDIYKNDQALGNSVGDNNTNNQYQNANFGDRDAGLINKSRITYQNNDAGNVDDSDYSSARFMNKSRLTISGVGNNNSIGNRTLYLGVDLTATNSLNNNTVYGGDMEFAFQYQYQYAHQYDHQMAFGSAFQDTENCNFYIPIQPVHLSQSNTGITGGDYAGAVVGPSSNAFNSTGSSFQGMVGVSLNTGGVAQNQAAANVVTAFRAQ